MNAQTLLNNERTQVLRETGTQLRDTLKKRSVKDLKSLVTGLWQSPRTRWVLYIPIGIVVALLTYWVYQLFTTESTDDAFVSAHVHIVGARVAGTVVAVPILDNQIVKKGDVLVKLDPKDFEVAQKIADATAKKAAANLGRWRERGLNPFELVQKAGDEADAQAAEARLEQANLNLKYTEVRATEDGKVGNRAVETGMQVQPGQALMALVEQTPWVIANFKEHQAARMRPGQSAVITIDAIAHHTFYGHVDSIAPGSGATFSLLPPDNATGNFTKIVQRIPVKIVFDAESIKGFEDRLTTGMSAAITVHH